jgi:hypothetical protein
MGRAIAKHFFHPDEYGGKRKKRKNDSNNNTYYYEKIPIKFDKVYRPINVELEHKCTSLVKNEQTLPIIVVLDKYLEELKTFIKNSPRYISSEFDVKYAQELPKTKIMVKDKEKEITFDWLDLLRSQKYFMHYLHNPKKDDGIWFCEGRFFSLEEIKKTKDENFHKAIKEFVLEKKINYLELLEEWVGLIFHLATEFLLIKKGLKTIFFSCENCHRPGVFIKGKLEGEDDPDKILGTINIVDTIIYNCINDLKLTEGNKSQNNIIVYDKSYSTRNKEDLEKYEALKKETDGAFIIVTNDTIFDNLIKEFQDCKNKVKFDLIIIGSEYNSIKKKIGTTNYRKYIDRKCIYNLTQENNNGIDNIKEIYNKPEELTKFIQSKTEEQEVYKSIKLLTYKDYTDKYILLHRLISRQYGLNKERKFKIQISYLKDFLLWNPELHIKKNDNEHISKIETFLNVLKEFEENNEKNNEEYIIKLYTINNGSYYNDFNYWLNSLDVLAIHKTSWFIAAVIFSLNEYSINKNKGIKEDGLKLYRGITSNLSTLLNYELAKDELICYPSFTSTTRLFDRAENFANEQKKENEYATIITINYKFKEGFLPTAVDVKDISLYPEEEECIFFPYSFFKVIDFKIDHSSKKAEIELETIGKKEIIETKIGYGNKLVYNEEGFMEVVSD